MSAPQIKPNTTLLKEEALPLPPPINRQHTIQLLILSQQNLLDACMDAARTINLLHQNVIGPTSVGQHLGATRVAATVAVDRMTLIIDRLKHPDSLK